MELVGNIVLFAIVGLPVWLMIAAGASDARRYGRDAVRDVHGYPRDR